MKTIIFASSRNTNEWHKEIRVIPHLTFSWWHVKSDILELHTRSNITYWIPLQIRCQRSQGGAQASKHPFVSNISIVSRHGTCVRAFWFSKCKINEWYSYDLSDISLRERERENHILELHMLKHYVRRHETHHDDVSCRPKYDHTIEARISNHPSENSQIQEMPLSQLLPRIEHYDSHRTVSSLKSQSRIYTTRFGDEEMCPWRRKIECPYL